MIPLVKQDAAETLQNHRESGHTLYALNWFRQGNLLIFKAIFIIFFTMNQSNKYIFTFQPITHAYYYVYT